MKAENESTTGLRCLDDQRGTELRLTDTNLFLSSEVLINYINHSEDRESARRTICKYGMETLKFSAKLANQTTRTLVTKNVPRLPCSDDKFHTPIICMRQYTSPTRLSVQQQHTLSTISSFGNKINPFSLMIAPRSLRSRYKRLVSYALLNDRVTHTATHTNAALRSEITYL